MSTDRMRFLVFVLISRGLQFSGHPLEFSMCPGAKIRRGSEIQVQKLEEGPKSSFDNGLITVFGRYQIFDNGLITVWTVINFLITVKTPKTFKYT